MDRLTLKPYQQYGAEWLADKSRTRRILADEAGNGKSAQVITAADIVYSRYKALSFENKAKYPRFQIWIVCPTFAVRSWVREIKKWSETNLERLQVIRKGKEEVDFTAHWVVMSYDIAKVKSNEIEIGVPTILICDECHYLSHKESARCRLVLDRIGAAARYVWLLTGTLFPNNRIDGWTLFNACDPKKYTYWRFAERFGYVREVRIPGGRRVKKAYGAQNESALIEWIKPFTLRRLAKDVLKDLPEFEDKEIYIEAPRNLKYTQDPAKKELLKKALSGDRSIDTTELATALKLLGEAKIDTTVEYCSSLIESDSGPLVVFAINISVVEGIAEGLRAKLGEDHRVEVFNGGVSADKRGQLVEEYEAGKISVLVCNIAAAGVAITLVKGNNAIYAQLPWTPGEFEQSRARIRRIGQKSLCVYSVILVENSLDETIYKVLKSKQRGVVAFDVEYSKQNHARQSI